MANNKKRKTKLDYQKPRVDDETLAAICGCCAMLALVVYVLVMLFTGAEL